MASIRVDAALYDQLRSHLRGHVEQAAFMLASFDEKARQFTLHELIVVSPEGLDAQRPDFIALSDDTKRGVIKRAWDSGLCLVEAHSHGEHGYAAFSLADAQGFAEWVPHLWWRLKGRPYAAIVTAGPTAFDAMAWVDGPREAEQVTHIDVVGGARMRPSSGTLGVEGVAGHVR